MKNLQIFLFFAVAISVIMAADLKIRNVKGGSSRSRGSSSSSSSRRSGSSGGASSLGNSNVNLGNHAGSFSGVQHSQSQGFQTHHQVSDLSQNSRKIGEKAPPKIDSSSGNKNNQNYKPNEGSARDGIGQMNGAPKQSSGLSPAGSAAVASNSMMFHNHRSNNNGNANKNAGGSSKSTTTTPKSPK